MPFCTGCGRSHEDGAGFCQDCGRALTPAPAAPPPPAPPPEAAPPPLQTSPPPPVGARPTVTNRRPVRLVAGIAAAVLAIAVGVTVWNPLGRGGGAESPEAAVRALADAAAKEDVAAVVGLLPPEETRRLLPLLDAVITKAADTGVVSKDAPGAGTTVEIKNLTTRVVAINDDVSAVHLTGGTMSGALDRNTLPGPIKDVVPEGTGGTKSMDFGELAKTWNRERNGEGMDLMTVRRNGRWYVSPLFTVTSWYQQSQGATATFVPNTAWPKPVTEPTPQAAVTKYVEALGRLNVEELQKRTAPGELAFSYGVAQDLQRELTRSLGRDATAGLEVSDLRATERDLPGSMKALVVDHLVLTATAQRDAAKMIVDGPCLRAESPSSSSSRSDKSCVDVRRLFLSESLTGAGDDARSRLVFVTVKTDDGWTVSPIASAAESAQTALDDIDRHLLAVSLLPTLEPPAAMLGTDQRVTVRLKPRESKIVKLTVGGSGAYRLSAPDIGTKPSCGLVGKWGGSLDQATDRCVAQLTGGDYYLRVDNPSDGDRDVEVGMWKA